MMSATSTDSLARAIEYLGAVEVAPGRYAVKDGERYLVIDESDVPGLAFEFETGEPDPDACAQVTEMPSWWSPEQRFAWRNYIGANRWATTVERVESVPSAGDNPWPVLSRERITADLETGAEIPARTTCEGVGF